MTGNQDALLREGLATGQQEAFGQLYDRYASRLYRAALRMVGNPQDAEDVVHEVFVALVRSRDKLARVDDLGAYLFTALRNTAGRHVLRRVKQPTISNRLIEQATDCLDERESPHVERLQRAVQNLPGEQREVIALKLDGQLTFEEIAEVLQINANTAASRYRYALEKLRTALGAER